MSSMHKSISALFFGSVLSFSLSQAKLQNLTTCKEEVKKYYLSGKYNKDFKKILERAWRTLNRRTVKENDTLVFDIDDTLWSSFHANKDFGFGNLFACNPQWATHANLPVIPESLDFYKKVLDKGYTIILLTNRDISFKKATEKNLAAAGYKGYKKLILRNDKEVANLNSHKFKELKRNELTKEGYTIIASIGDQKSDVAGENSGIKILLPNYMYCSP